MPARLVISGPRLSELYHLDWRLLQIVQDALSRLDGDLTVTSIYRTRAEDTALGGSGVHSTPRPHRAIDLVGELTQLEYEALAAELNAIWEYDNTRPNMGVAVGREHGTGPHLHLQVHPATARRAKDG